MYIPKPFQVDDKEILHAFMRANSFATLVTQGDGEPFASHLPLLLESDAGPWGTLHGHMARANPQWQGFPNEEALVIFQGPHAYISPQWHGVELRAPTWNYTAVHAYGRPRIIEEPEELFKLLSEMTQTYEGGFEEPWSVEKLPPDYVQSFFKAIVGFRMEITRLEGKFKLSQNRPSEERERVAAALKGLNDPQSVAVAEWMERTIR